MKKLLKRSIQVLLILIVLIIAVFIIVPVVFKPQLMELTKKEISNRVNAKVEFKDFQVSLIKGFPNLYVGLKGLTVVGVNNFANDTLVSIENFSVTVDLMSVIGRKNIKLKSILLDKPRFTAIITHKGKVNLDIVKPSTVAPTTQPSSKVQTEPSKINIALRKFEIRDATIKYMDDSSKMSSTISNLNFLLSGNLGAEYTNLKIRSSADAFTLTMNGIKYFNKVQFSFSGEIGADLVNKVYTLKDNVFSLNAIQLNFAGSLKMTKADIDVDLTYNTSKADFKSILSLVPAIYMKDFEGLQTSGKVTFQGFAKGMYNHKKMPSAGIELIVENAMFKYPKLPKSADNINLNAKINFDGTSMDRSTVDINQLHVELAGNPLDAQVHITTPMSDMQIAGLFKGKIDFTSIADVIPLDSMKIKGLLESNIQFGGKMSYIDKQQYDMFNANGTMKLTNFELTNSFLPQGIKIVEASMQFSPKFVDLISFDSQIGKSDMKMNGRLENFIPYLFNHQTLNGNLNVSSTLFDVNEFLTKEASQKKTVSQVKLIPVDTKTASVTNVSSVTNTSLETNTTSDTNTTSETNTSLVKSKSISVFEIPKNIDFVIKANISRTYYDKLDISDLNGKLLVKDGKVIMDNISMKMLEGSMVVSGEYNSQTIKNPTVALDLNVVGFDIPTTIKSFSLVNKIASSGREVKGKVSTKFTMTATLDTTMSPILNSINARGILQSDNIEFTNSKVFSMMADVLKNEAFRNPSMKNVSFNFTVKDGRIYIEPFDTNIAAFKMNIGGDMGLDQTLNLKAKTSIPRSSLGVANDLINALSSFASSKGVKVKLSEDIKMNLKIRGTTTNPEIRPEW